MSDWAERLIAVAAVLAAVVVIVSFVVRTSRTVTRVSEVLGHDKDGETVMDHLCGTETRLNTLEGRVDALEGRVAAVEQQTHTTSKEME